MSEVHDDTTSNDGTATTADAERLNDMLETLAAISAGDGPGVTRLAFSPEERRAHDQVQAWAAELELDVWSDAVGNTIAELPGSRSDRPAIGLGSHLDSVPNGGRFDGIAGVVAALETVRVLREQGEVLEHPVRVVAFAAEEGSRFGEPCIGSKAVAGLLDARVLERARDVDGTTIPEAMREVGLDPARLDEASWDRDRWAGFFELHVEQGQVLEEHGVEIGLVDHVSGSSRLVLHVTGAARHSGATPMALRHDALVGACEIVLAGETLAGDTRYRGTRVTVGRLDVQPNSITTIPGAVSFSVDVRDIDSVRQRRAAVELTDRAEEICERRGLDLTAEVLADSSPTVLPAWLRELTRAACDASAASYRVVTSGASHDAQVVGRVMPSAMIFVPSHGGLSHVPGEWTTPGQLARGVDVLTESVRRFDRFLAHDGAAATTGTS